MIDQGSVYFKQARLLLRSLPLVHEEQKFALKGGTAINFFIRDLPRLSVDIDLVYIPVESRETTLVNIGNALMSIADRIQRSVTGTEISTSILRESGTVAKLFLKLGGVQIKIEPNLIMRGTIYPCTTVELTPFTQDFFQLGAAARIVSFEELYAGKICAALDRQHPRDLFDVLRLLEHEGITPDILKAFTIYLASHDRPMHELLEPNRKDIRRLYENEFSGLSREEITLNDLIDARETLINLIRADMADNSRKFLVSLKQGQPDWELPGIHGVEQLPALQWKLRNIRRMNRHRHDIQLNALRNILGI